MLKRFVCNCNCSQAVDMSNDFKYSTCFVQGKTVFADGRVNFFCLNYEPVPEVQADAPSGKVVICPKCGLEPLATPDEFEAGMCISCLAQKGGGNDPETDLKKGAEK